MPTVPRAQRTVESVAMPNAYAPSPSIIQSPDFVTPTNKVFATAEKIMQEEVNKVNQVALLDADNQLSALKLRISSDVDKLKGKDAAGAIGYAATEWDTQAASIKKGLGNEAQRMAFDAKNQSYKYELDGYTQRHYAVERRDYDIKTTDASISNSIEDAAANYKNSDYVQERWLKMQAAIKDHATRNGFGPEQIKAQTAKNEEAFHVAQINRMHADGDDLAARDYLQAHSSEITDTAIREKVATASSDGEGARIEEAAWVKYGPKKPGDTVNEYDIAQEIERTSGGDAKISKSGKSFSKERIILWNAQVKANKDASTAKVWRAVADGASLTNIKKMPEYLNLDGKEANTVKEHVIDRANTLLGRQAEKTTPAQDVAYWKYYGKLDTMTEDSILSLYPTLGRKRTNDLMEAKSKLSNEAEKFTQMTVLQSVDTRWAGMGFTEEGKQGIALAAFKTAVFDRINLLEKTTLGGKRKANHEEVTAIINELSAKNLMVTFEQGWFGLEKETPPGEVPDGTPIEGVRFVPSKQAGSINLKVGDTKNGYRYKGGDPSKKESWTKL